MTEPPAQPAVAPDAAPDQASEAKGVRAITDVQTLKALADPTRLAILTTLMQGPGQQPRLMTVKELAAELGEPQTKLYRHVRQLETAGLIKSAASRMVSGILEHRYEACQQDLTLGPDLVRDRAAADDFAAAVSEIVNRYLGQFFAAYRAGQILTSADEGGDPLRRGLLDLAETRVTPARAVAIRTALQQIADELTQANQDQAEDGVPVNVLIGFYSPSESRPG
jgi:DNA-binding transcriptional ArsR family regulator